MHLYNVGFFDEDASARWVAVDGTALPAKGGALGCREWGVLGARAGWIAVHCVCWGRGEE